MPAIKGEMISSIAVSTDCGSDVAAVKTFAEKKGDSYILNGQKCLSQIVQADFLTLLCRTSMDKGYKGFSLSCQ